MINTAELTVARGYESRSWLCMFRPHGQERHHIASSVHKWTCLFWLVQGIFSPRAPPPPATDIPRFNSVSTNQSDWLLLSMSSPTRVRSCLIHPPTPPAAVSLERECGSAGERHFQIWKGRDGGFQAGQVTGRCRFCHSMNQRQRWRWCKTRRGSVFSWSLHLHGRESTNWKQPIKKKCKIHNLICRVLGLNSFLCSITVYVKWKMPQLMFMTD